MGAFGMGSHTHALRAEKENEAPLATGVTCGRDKGQVLMGGSSHFTVQMPVLAWDQSPGLCEPSFHITDQI